MMMFPPTFPVFALPDRLRAAVSDAHEYTGAPIPLIVVSALAALSAAAQGSYTVERPGGLIGPVSLYFVVAAESGERKSTVDKLFTRGLREFERLHRALAKQEEATYHGKIQSWKCQVKAIRRMIEKDTVNGVSDHSANTQRLRDLMEQKPESPRSTRLLYEDCTSAALKSGLAEWPFAAVISDEAQTVLNLLMREPALLNGLWSGGDLLVDRKTSASLMANNPRLTLSLMIQPSVLLEFMKNHGDTTRGIGLWARILFCNPASTQGFRYNAGCEPEWTHLSVFNKLILDLLDEQMACTVDEFVTLRFSQNAKSKWLEYVNNIERRMGPGMDYHGIKDYASKTGENIARLAALFHVAQSRHDGLIQMETIINAQEVMFWFFGEFQRNFDGTHAEPQFVQDAIKLNQWLHGKCWGQGMNWIKKTYAQKFCPNALRKNGRFRAALQYLLRMGHVWVGYDPIGTGLQRTLVIKPMTQPVYNRF